MGRMEGRVWKRGWEGLLVKSWLRSKALGLRKGRPNGIRYHDTNYVEMRKIILVVLLMGQRLRRVKWIDPPD